MNDLGGEGDYDDGVATTTHLSQLLLGGQRRRLSDEFTGGAYA